MTDSPPGGPEDQLPSVGGRRVLMFDDDEPDRDAARPGRRALLARTLVVLVLGAAGVWAWRACSDVRPGAPADQGISPVGPTSPAVAPPVDPGPDTASAVVEATAGTTVQLEVEATDAFGVPLGDTLLRLTVESGSGTLGADVVRTDSSGVARAVLTLAPQPEITVVVARVVGAAVPPKRVNVIGGVGPAERIDKVDGDGQVTYPGGLLEGLVIRVTDAAGNPVDDVQVFFAPDPENGLAAPSRIRTDSLGLASAIWRLGANPGVQRLTAAVAGAVIPPVTFTATALGDTTAAASEPPAEDTALTSGPETEPPPEPEPEPVTVVRRTFAVGGTFVCSVSTGRAACRGANDRGQSGGGAGAGFVSVALGVSHACALDAAGAASCWGANDGGQLGDGSRTDRTVPVPVATELRFSLLAAGAGHTCGLSSGGRAVCWGRNLSGQLGDGTREDRSTPTPLPADRSFRNLVAGWDHTCGSSAGGELACWGGNGQGQLGDGSRLDRLTPTTVPGSFTSVVAGSRHTCGISGDRVLCWGDNGFGQLGDGSTQTRTSPTAVTDLPGAPIRLAAGAVHTCALLEGGAAWCWGQNLHGQLGDGTTQRRMAPSRVTGDLTFTSLYAGGAATCGFATDGSQYCWGLNQTGQLGDGTRDNRASPTRVGG